MFTGDGQVSCVHWSSGPPLHTETLAVHARISTKPSTSPGHAIYLSERSDAIIHIIHSTGRHGQGRKEQSPGQSHLNDRTYAVERL